MNRYNNTFLDTPIEYLKGVGPKNAALLQKERSIFVFGDLLYDFPFRHEDRTTILPINKLQTSDFPVQVKGILGPLRVEGHGRKKRLKSFIKDSTGTLSLVWFKGVDWVKESLQVGKEYVAYGKLNHFKGMVNMPHPELELSHQHQQKESHLAPVYNSTEMLTKRGMNQKKRRTLIQKLLELLKDEHIQDPIPEYIREKLKLPTLYQALRSIHQPKSSKEAKLAIDRLKFNEIFLYQVVLCKKNKDHKIQIAGHSFPQLGEHFHYFYENKIPFELTNAQKRVLKEIRKDLRSGSHMNRLLQGDVGSGKTMVGLMSMLMAIDNGFQTCLLAPTEILAQQHYNSIKKYLEGMSVRVAFLSGSIKGKARKTILRMTRDGDVDILIGTHAILEPTVVFKNLGLAITDEQHRFGVKQRAQLWKKHEDKPPHVLVMTATPIPRTLYMTMYGNLDVSIIDELPPGRKPVKTIHVFESKRMEVYDFMRKEIHKGRQIYIVYPLIEESEKLDLQDLMNGFERLLRYFPRPQYQMSMVHGQMKPEEKEFEMQRFVKNETQIMVATTVIEVGVNVPNASVMLIENAERFGLSQLHQLRGRVGRGADQSYCLLLSGYRLSNDSKKRLQTMVDYTDGFKIAEVDLELRGPGEITGLRQSGTEFFKLASLVDDKEMISYARAIAKSVLHDDPKLEDPKHQRLRAFTERSGKRMQFWSHIS